MLAGKFTSTLNMLHPNTVHKRVDHASTPFLILLTFMFVNDLVEILRANTILPTLFCLFRTFSRYLRVSEVFRKNKIGGCYHPR